MQDKLISCETAKLAEEKGFKNKNYYFGYKDDKLVVKDQYPNTIKAYTQSLLQKWLREKHNIDVLIKYDSPVRPKYPIRYTFYIYTTLDWYSQHTYITFEEALEAGLYEALKLIKEWKIYLYHLKQQN